MKEIKFNNLSIPLQLISVFTIIASICIITYLIYPYPFKSYDNLQKQIDALPHKVCHNETVILTNDSMVTTCLEQVYNNYNRTFDNNTYGNYLSSFMCEVLNSKEEQKEVCEIK